MTWALGVGVFVGGVRRRALRGGRQRESTAVVTPTATATVGWSVGRVTVRGGVRATVLHVRAIVHALVSPRLVVEGADR